MPSETPVQTYKSLFRLDEPIPVWTPDGGYNTPTLIAESKTPVSMSLSQTITFLRGQNPKQRPVTSGEWHQVRKALETANSDIEADMITGPYERTSTLVDYDHGLVIQIPDVDAEGNLITDEKGIIKGRHTWEMALPRKGGYTGQMPADLAMFFNTIYGMEDAARQLPSYAYFYIDENPTRVRNLLRGRWFRGTSAYRRVVVDGLWRPSSSRGYVASRGALDKAKLVNRLNDAKYRANIQTLLERAGQVTPEEAAELIERINEQTKGALVWEDI